MSPKLLVTDVKVKKPIIS